MSNYEKGMLAYENLEPMPWDACRRPRKEDY